MFLDVLDRDSIGQSLFREYLVTDMTLWEVQDLLNLSPWDCSSLFSIYIQHVTTCVIPELGILLCYSCVRNVCFTPGRRILLSVC